MTWCPRALSPWARLCSVSSTPPPSPEPNGPTGVEAKRRRRGVGVSFTLVSIYLINQRDSLTQKLRRWMLAYEASVSRVESDKVGE